MSQYIILLDMRDGSPGIAAIRNAKDEISIFDDIAEAADICKNNDACHAFPCEIIDLDELGWGD